MGDVHVHVLYMYQGAGYNGAYTCMYTLYTYMCTYTYTYVARL